jgi:hypothetical protein
MKRFALTTALVAVAIWSTAAEGVRAQQYQPNQQLMMPNQLGSSSGSLGGMGSIGGGSQQFGGSGGSFGSRGSMGSFTNPGQRTLTGSGGGGVGGGRAGGVGQGGGIDGQMSVGDLTGNERFVRGNRQPGQFVGSDGADVQAFIGAMTQGGMRGSQNPFGGGAGRGQQRQNANQDDGFGGSGRNGTRRPLRASLNVDFEYRPVVPATLGTQLQTQLSRSRGIKRLGDITVEMDGRTAVLRGEVATERDRALAGRLALLEAGVSQVRNELLVESAVNKPVVAPRRAPAAELPELPSP